jgi:hypothetical protein
VRPGSSYTAESTAWTAPAGFDGEFPGQCGGPVWRRPGHAVCLSSSTARAVLPPPEEEKDVKTAIGAARAKKARTMV